MSDDLLPWYERELSLVKDAAARFASQHPKIAARLNLGSDAVAETLRRLDIPFIALNPGASYRGLHDSIVNYLGNRTPQMILCLHDEHAVHIAQGYWKASGRLMASALHSNVGLMHASMPIFNAWCDRTPVLILGANGPMDAARRRPWIEWIHTCADQASLVRDFTKWDNQPASVPAAVEALLRARQIALTAPRGPVYVNLDVALQEDRIPAMPPMPDFDRFAAPQDVHPSPDLVKQAAALLSNAKRPVMLAGRVSRSLDGWNARVALAEKLQMESVSHIKLAASFPTLCTDLAESLRGVHRARRVPARPGSMAGPAQSTARPSPGPVPSPPRPAPVEEPR
jgi:thiamine pyrophosphate-dependent acetolactate synthase large subunit-like protein